MTAARFVDSLRYGGKLVGFLLAVVLVGGAAIVGGAALAVPESLGLAASASTARRVGGLALASFGVLAVVIGVVAFVHKLVADAVARGVAHGTPEPPSPTASGAGNAVADDGSPPGATDHVDGETEAEEWFEDPAPEPETGTTPTEGDAPPAPSAAEIAFGSSGEAEERESTPDAPEDPGGGVEPSAGPTASEAGTVVPESSESDDPLADRGEE